MAIDTTDYSEVATFDSELVQKRYIITGAPGVGKTTIIKYLEGQGEAVVHEAARDLINGELNKGIPKPWPQAEFFEKITTLQKTRQLEASATKVQRLFFDRSPIDTMTIYSVLVAEPTAELKHAVQHILDEEFYQKTVFLIENLGFCEQDAVRCETQEEALKIQERLKENYTQLGFDVVSIPAGSVEDRVARIFSVLSDAL